MTTPEAFRPGLADPSFRFGSGSKGKRAVFELVGDSFMTYATSHQRWASDTEKDLCRVLSRRSAPGPFHGMVDPPQLKGWSTEARPEWFIEVESSWAECGRWTGADETYKAFIKSVSSLTESRDPYTAGHQIKVSELAEGIAREMGLPADTIEGIRVAGIVHDMGKLSVPAEIVTKPGALTPLEFSIIKEHPRKAFEILKEIDFPWPVAETVFQHHERLDGSGYPLGLKRDNIRIEARVLAVADVVGAISSHRPYRRNLGIGAALREIDKRMGIFYDPDVARACRRSLKRPNGRIAQA